MAQTHHLNYLDDDDTDLLNRWFLGAIPPGLYRGFDYDPSSSGLNLKLYHSLTGFKETDIALAVSAFQGMVRTKQGVSISENAAVTISVTANNVSNPRIDVVVMEHEYVAVAGGVNAGYTVIQGTAASTPAIPALTFPEKQIILGYVEWPANTNAITGAFYRKAQAPMLFNDRLQKLQNGLVFNKGLATINTSTGEIGLDGKANFYELKYNFSDTDIKGITGYSGLSGSGDSTSRGGGLIYLKLTDTGTQGTVSLFHNVGVSAGFKPFNMPNGVSPQLNDGAILTLVENETKYEVVDITDSSLSIADFWKETTAVDQYRERIFHKSISTAWKILPNTAFNISTGILTITDEGNSFRVSVPSANNGGILKDIRISRNGGSTVACPSGMVINIQFFHSAYNTAVDEPFYFLIAGLGANIRISSTDEMRSPAGFSDRYHILTDALPLPNGDTYTFRKSNAEWEVIGYNLFPEILDRLSTHDDQLNQLLNAAPLINWIQIGSGGGAPNFNDPFWSQHPTSPLRYRKDTDGKITFTGAVVCGGGATPSTNLFNLPATFRPAKDEIFSGRQVTTGNVHSSISISVAASGAVEIVSNAQTSNTYWVSGITFYNT